MAKRKLQRITLPPLVWPRPDVQYYIYMASIDGFDALKIGMTDGPHTRLSALQSHCPHPVTLLGVARTADPRGVERSLHERFAAHRIRGEWYRPHPDIRAYARENLVSVESAARWMSRVLLDHVDIHGDRAIEWARARLSKFHGRSITAEALRDWASGAVPMNGTIERWMIRLTAVGVGQAMEETAQ